MMNSGVRQHIATLNACNQRGGRMLSMIDLINAESVNLDLAAYLVAMMRNGASLLVGARPGGAGKTAVMVACLNFVPDDTEIVVVDQPSAVYNEGEVGDHNRCFLAHEIGAGTYYAYVWGKEAREFFALTEKGYTIASNLHTDTLEQLITQLCEQNHIPKPLVDNVTMKIFLRMRRSPAGLWQRWVRRVYENDGGVDHLIWIGDQNGIFTRIKKSSYVTTADESAAAHFLNSCQEKNLVTIESLRQELIYK